MKKSAFWAAGTFVLAVCACGIAQETAPLVPVPQKEVWAVPLKIRNAPPDLMGFWLDPNHNEAPGESKTSMVSNHPIRRRGGGGSFQLPEGVDYVVSLAPQSAILVVGTLEGISELRDTIAFLDQPLKFMEWEAKIVRGKKTDLFGTLVGRANAPVSGEILNQSAQRTLDCWLQTNPAAILSSTRVKILNNLSEMLEFVHSAPLFGNVPFGKPQKWNTKLLLTATLNADESILASLDWTDTGNPQSNFNARHSQTTLLDFFTSKPGESTLFLLLTPHIMRPALQNPVPTP